MGAQPSVDPARAARLQARPPIRAYRVPLPPHFAERHGNAYLLPGGDRGDAVLVDPGPDCPEARQLLTEALAALGLKPRDLKTVALTGWQSERSGLVGWLSAFSAPTVIALGGVGGMARALAVSRQADRSLEAAARWAGATPWALDRVRELLADRRRYQPVWQPTASQRWLDPQPGKGIRLGEEAWEPRRPGLATAGAAAFWHAPSRTLIGGDLLDRASGLRLPLPQPFPDWPRALGMVLLAWQSLGRKAIDLILPGHGASIRSHRVLIARRLAQIALLQRGILAAAATESLSPWDIWQQLEQVTPTDTDLPERLAGLMALLAQLEQRDLLQREGPAASARFRSKRSDRPR